MAKTSWPRVNEDTTDAQYGELFDAVIGSGVRSLTDLTVTGDGSGLNVKVAAGFGVVSGNAFLSTAIETLTIAANTSGNPRNDLIVLRRDFTAAAGRTVDLAVKQGTPAASPNDPALSADSRAVYELPLARVSVAAGAATISAAAVTDLRPLLSSRAGTWRTTERPAARQGLVGFNRTTGRWEHNDGSTWRDLLAWPDIQGKPAAFPPAAHSHAAGDLPVVPIDKGGSGATTAAAALEAFGIFVRATDPGHANGRVWIKRP